MADATVLRSRLGPGAMSDELLARRAGAGSEHAFAALYERYHQPLYRYCRALLRDEHAAADALQSTFLAALSALRRRQRDAPLRPWLFRIAHNESISLLRRRAREDVAAAAPVGVAAGLASTSVACPTPLWTSAGTASTSTEETAALRQRMATLLEDLAALGERQRGALVLRELSGLSHAEIALALQISVGAAKQAILEARQALAEFEEGRAMTCDEVRERISAGDGRVLRGRRVRGHLRDCQACSAFAAAIPARRAQLRALVPPLAPVAAARLLGQLAAGARAGGGSATAGASNGATASAGSSAASAGSSAAGAGSTAAAAGKLALAAGPGKLVASAAAVIAVSAGAAALTHNLPGVSAGGASRPAVARLAGPRRGGAVRVDAGSGHQNTAHFSTRGRSGAPDSTRLSSATNGPGVGKRARATVGAGSTPARGGHRAGAQSTVVGRAGSAGAAANQGSPAAAGSREQHTGARGASGRARSAKGASRSRGGGRSAAPRANHGRGRGLGRSAVRGRGRHAGAGGGSHGSNPRSSGRSGGLGASGSKHGAGSAGGASGAGAQGAADGASGASTAGGSGATSGASAAGGSSARGGTSAQLVSR
jgi:RNA polymerase sigma factor (sigma-70 family)